MIWPLVTSVFAFELFAAGGLVAERRLVEAEDRGLEHGGPSNGESSESGIWYRYQVGIMLTQAGIGVNTSERCPPRICSLFAHLIRLFLHHVGDIRLSAAARLHVGSTSI